MNVKRRSRVKNALEYLEIASDIIEDVRMEEEDSLENIPENLQNSDRYESMGEIVDILSEATDDIGSTISRLESIL